MLLWSRRHKMFLCALLSLGSLLTSWTVRADSPCYGISERSVTVKKSYKSHPGDTLAKVAFLLYGHRSWGKVILDQNPNLKGIGDQEKLPPRTLIRYAGPRIGDAYRVKPNDILSRIAEWKYGTSENWREIVAMNPSLRSRPNQITPGECLVFHEEKRKIASFPVPAPVPNLEVALPYTEVVEIVNKIYRTGHNDSLSKAAFLLYGHRSWGQKLVRLNPALKNYGENQKLPANLAINYRGPKITNLYIVRKDDILSRIAEWKYGASEEWKKIAAKNKNLINDPDLIYPGDRLVFDENGNIKNLTTSRVLVTASTQAPSPPSPPQKNMVQRGLASIPLDSETLDRFFLPLGALVIFFLLFLLYRRMLGGRRQVGLTKSSDFPFDASAPGYENIELDQVPNYNSLLKKWYKYLVVLQKRLKMRR